MPGSLSSRFFLDDGSPGRPNSSPARTRHRFSHSTSTILSFLSIKGGDHEGVPQGQSRSAKQRRPFKQEELSPDGADRPRSTPLGQSQRSRHHSKRQSSTASPSNEEGRTEGSALGLGEEDYHSVPISTQSAASCSCSDAGRSESASEPQEILVCPVYGLWNPDASRPTSLPPPPRSPTSALARKRLQISPHRSYSETPTLASIDSALLGDRPYSRTSSTHLGTAWSAPTSPILPITDEEELAAHGTLDIRYHSYPRQQPSMSNTTTSVAFQPRPMVRSSSHRVVPTFAEAAQTKTVRRGEGSRAGSEASASLRSKSAQGDIPVPSRSLSVGKSTTAAPRSNSSFSTVRRIFRSRSKSVSAPSRRSIASDTIPETDEFGRLDSNTTSSIPPASRRERKTSFFFNRSKSNKAEAESAKRAARIVDPLVVIQGPPSSVRGSLDSYATSSTPATTPPANEISTPQQRSTATFNGMTSNADRSLTLQAIESATPYATRKPSPPVIEDQSRIEGEGDEQDGNRVVTPTPAKRAMPGYSEEADEGTGVAYSTTTPSQKGSSPAPKASVPKMWQMQASDGEGSHDRSYSRQITASATSGSMSSYRTAASTPRPTSPSRAPKSPLSDLIFNLERRLSSPRIGERSVLGRPNGRDTPTQQLLSYIPPYRTIRRLEDDNMSLPSSSSSNTAERDHGIMSGSMQQDVDSTPTARRSRVGDISMSDIEESVAAVEAALQDHSTAGSFDPSQLRKKMITARHVSVMGSEIVTEEDLRDFEMLSQSPNVRIRIPPELENSIRGSIMEVRRALSSSHLPMIPNEDETISEYSHGNTLRPGVLSGNSTTLESTPIRAARGRQESMQDVEAAYARMIDLVGTAAGMDMSAHSPLANATSLSARAIPTTSFAPGSGNLTYPSPRQSAHGRSQSAAIQTPMSRAARQQLLRESDNIARLKQTSRETDEPVLRGRASSLSAGGSRRALSESPPHQREASSGGIKVNLTPAQLQQLLQHQKANGRRVSIEEPVGSSAPTSGAGTTLGTSPSVTVKTQGTPRSIEMDHVPSHSQQIHDWNQNRISASPSSVRPVLSLAQNKSSLESSNVFNGIDGRMMEEQRRRNRALVSGMPSSPRQTAAASHQRQSSLLREFPQMSDSVFRPQSGASDYTSAMQQRHALERDSLLDMLNRSRSEATALLGRTKSLEADLHQEVTRVLELQREIHRQRENEQMMRQKEQAMQQRISMLEQELKHEHDDRLRIAELLERVQTAVDNATKTEIGHNPLRGSTYLADAMLANGHEGWTSTHPDTYRGDSLLDSSVDASDSYAERRSPSLRSYPSMLGVADEDEMSWSLDREEEPIDDREAPSASTTSNNTRVEPTTEAPVKDPSIPVPVAVASSPRPSGLPVKRVSRLPVLTSPPMTSSSTMTPVAANSSSVSSRSSLASRFGGGSMIGKPRTSTGIASVASSSPQSIRNLSTSSSVGGNGSTPLRYAGLPVTQPSPSARKASAASRFTNTTGGDTSYTARTPEMVDVTALDDLGNDSSFT